MSWKDLSLRTRISRNSLFSQISRNLTLTQLAKEKGLEKRTQGQNLCKYIIFFDKLW